MKRTADHDLIRAEQTHHPDVLIDLRRERWIDRAIRIQQGDLRAAYVVDL